MALTKNDCLLLLSELAESGVDTAKVTSDLYAQKDLPLSVIKFINDNRELDLTKFYTKLRKSYNEKHSKLYYNIVKEVDDVTSVLTTLSALQLQILLYSKQVSNVEMFFKNARLSEIAYALLNYAKTYDLTPCLKVLRFVKTDLKALESL